MTSTDEHILAYPPFSPGPARLEPVHLHGFGRDGQPSLLIGQEGANIVALVTLQLDDVADLFVVHDGAIASEFLLDHFEDLFEVEFGGDTGNGGQGFTTITLLDADMNLVLGRLGLGFGRGSFVLRVRERIKSLQVLDTGHTSFSTKTLSVLY